MSSELASVLEEVINREANSKLRKQIDEAFGNFETALAELCHGYDVDVPHSPEFAEKWRAYKQQVFAATSEAARMHATEHFIRKVTSGHAERPKKPCRFGGFLGTRGT
jgi:hypothetical protein